MSYCTTCKFEIKSCICQPFWSTFDTKFANEPLLTISTITTNFKIKFVFVNLEKLVQCFQPTTFAMNIHYKRNSKKSRDDSDVNFQMYNACVVSGYIPKLGSTTDELVKVTTKIFHNGSFNITGCQSMHNIIVYIQNLLIMLNRIPNVLERCHVYEYTDVTRLCIAFTKKKVQFFDHIKRVRFENRSLGNSKENPRKFERIRQLEMLFINEITGILERKWFYNFHSIILEDYVHKQMGHLRDITLHDVKIPMINSYFSIQRRVYQRKLALLLNEPEYSFTNDKNQGNILSCQFNVFNYHAVKIKYIYLKGNYEKEYLTRKRLKKLQGEISIAIFNTGSVLITGTEPDEIIDAFHFILRLFETHPELSCDDPSLLQRRRKKNVHRFTGQNEQGYSDLRCEQQQHQRQVTRGNSNHLEE
jgi:TATA-box binding protein (TBP) (component of TFIID and TFIIIB)